MSASRPTGGRDPDPDPVRGRRRGTRLGGTWRTRARRVALAVALSLVVRTAIAASAANLEGQVPELLDWIAATTGRDVDSVRRAPPEVVFAAPFEALRFGAETLRVAPDVGGIWDTETRRIVLVRPWRASDPVDLSILLHELVHALQSEQGGDVCDAEAEWEAYALQARWLAERDIVMLIDWHEVREHSLCPEDALP